MNIWAFIPLITCVVYILLFMMTLPTTSRQVNKIFAYFLAVASLWSFTSFMLHLDFDPRLTLLWNQLVLITLIWTLMAYFHFILTYAERPARRVLYLGYGLFFGLSLLTAYGYIVEYAYVVDGVLMHSLGNSIYLIGGVSLFFIGGGIVTLIGKYRRTREKSARNRVLYLIVGWTILMTMAYSNLIPAVAGLPLDHIGSLINALIIAYTISRYKLLDIKLVIRKGLVYSGLTIFLTTLYLLILFVVQMLFQDRFGYTSLLIATLVALLTALLFNPFRNGIQKWIDKLFYRETYDYRQMLLNFSRRISNVLDLDELANSILDPIVGSMHVKKAALMFPESGSNEYRTNFARPKDTVAAFYRMRLLDDNPLVIWLAEKGQIVQRSMIGLQPQFKGLWQAERMAFDELGIELLCPIRSKGHLIGILVLGEKRSGSPYSEDEINLLTTMSNEAAIVIENARMLTSIKDHQIQVEQLLAQVVMAQEEERKRISADLHDSVAQWLAAASYRVQTANALLPVESTSAAKTELMTMEDTIDKSLKELRRIVVGLRPPALDELGLEHSVQQMLDELKQDGVVCRFNRSGVPIRLSASLEIAVYRTVQEGLTNIRKHAGANMVKLSMRYQPDMITIQIEDNGKGFDFTRTLRSAVSVGHMGMLGMKQRAETLGGEMTVTTAEGIGTTITLNIPIQTPLGEI